MESQIHWLKIFSIDGLRFDGILRGFQKKYSIWIEDLQSKLFTRVGKCFCVPSGYLLRYIPIARPTANKSVDKGLF